MQRRQAAHSRSHVQGPFQQSLPPPGNSLRVFAKLLLLTVVGQAEISLWEAWVWPQTL